ncbi:MAG: DNA (cytosine-5-)-methyltransferase, partial [Candidatus Accumulibacter sp.]|nr:DNA (cytosine-5-)-methyltransferase [Accumulibacter sp.]
MQPATSVSGFSQLRTLAGLSIEQICELGGYSQSTLYRWERGDTNPRKAAVELLQRIIDERRAKDRQGSNFRFIDLFAGIGGLRRGFEPLGGKCVFTCEWNRYSQLTYKANYDCDHEIAGDITMVPVNSIPQHDLLLAGFPCQPFSIAGVSKKNALGRAHGFRCKAQGTLFFNVAEIIEYHRPRAFLLENVKNLVNHDRGRTFEVIHKRLAEDFGYQVHWKVIDARSWVPQ